MKISKLNTAFIALFLSIISFSSIGQTTAYDQLPDINPMYKPNQSIDFPEWGKRLYQNNVNYLEIEQLFKADNGKYKQKCALLRYYKIWKKGVIQFVQNDGSIALPNLSSYQTNFGNKNGIEPSTSAAVDWGFVGPVETFWLNESGSSTTPVAASWQANVYSFDISESNTSLLFAGTETGFLNKTIDNGLTWTLVGQDYNFGGGITAVCIHPTNPDIVFVGSGAYTHKSVDGGTNWTSSITASGNSITKILIDPTNTQNMMSCGNNGIFKSTDAGSTWSSSYSTITWDIEFRPDNPLIVYGISRTSGNFNLLSSTDGGVNFTSIGNLPIYSENSGGLLGVSADNPDILYVGMLSDNNTPYLVMGTDLGTSWSFLTTATGLSTPFPMNNGQGFFDFGLDVNPSDANEVFIGTGSLYKSSDGGVNFTAIGGYQGSFSIHPDIQWVKYADGNNIWIATDGGMNYSTDAFSSAGNYTARNRGLIGSHMWGFDQGWNEDITVGGRYHNGNTAIADFYGPKALRMGGAESPTGWVMQGKSKHVAFDDLGQGWILPPAAEAQHEGRFTYSLYPNMDEYGGRRSNLIHHPNYYGTLYLGQGDVFWKSTDMGVNFEMMFTFPDRIRYVEMSTSNPLIFYADIQNNGLYKTEDGGLSWTNKPSLTNSYGTTYWEGRTFFVISPIDENTIYACLQNGTWTSDIGNVYKSNDGGDSWIDWTGTLNGFTKNMVIQPASGNKDIVYLFTSKGNGTIAKAYYRYSDELDWTELGTDFPAGFDINIGKPFFRDSKIRVAGNCGIWEHDLLENNYTPIINPWVLAQNSGCIADTLQFNDHSIIDHSGVSWSWNIFPAPLFIDNANIRNPKVVLGAIGNYDVTLSLTKAGITYTKTVNSMVIGSECPSVTNCSNPAVIPKSSWSVISFDSEEQNNPGLASMAIDDNFSTIWHTSWSASTDPYPHQIVIDLDSSYLISSFIYYPRTDGVNGRISDYEIYIDDNTEPTTLVASGTWSNSASPSSVDLTGSSINGSYLRLVALSEVNGGAWASCAEIELIGCYTSISSIDDQKLVHLKAFPIPVQDILNVNVGMVGQFDVKITEISGRIESYIENVYVDNTLELSMQNLTAGQYIVELINRSGKTFIIKVIKGN